MVMSSFTCVSKILIQASGGSIKFVVPTFKHKNIFSIHVHCTMMIIIKYYFVLVFDYFHTNLFRLENYDGNKNLIKLIQKQYIKIRSNTYYILYRICMYILHVLCLIQYLKLKKENDCVAKRITATAATLL